MAMSPSPSSAGIATTGPDAPVLDRALLHAVTPVHLRPRDRESPRRPCPARRGPRFSCAWVPRRTAWPWPTASAVDGGHRVRRRRLAVADGPPPPGGQHPRRARWRRRRRYWRDDRWRGRPRGRGWWIAVLFMVGSSLFALGAVPWYAEAVGRAGHRAHVLRRLAVLHLGRVPAVPPGRRRRSHPGRPVRTSPCSCGRRGTSTGWPAPCSSPARCGSTGAPATRCAHNLERGGRRRARLAAGRPRLDRLPRRQRAGLRGGATRAGRAAHRTTDWWIGVANMAGLRRLRRLGDRLVHRPGDRRRVGRRAVQPRHVRRRAVLPGRRRPAAPGGPARRPPEARVVRRGARRSARLRG